MRQLLYTINTLFPVVNFFKCVKLQKSLFSIVALTHRHFTR